MLSFPLLLSIAPRGYITSLLPSPRAVHMRKRGKKKITNNTIPGHHLASSAISALHSPALAIASARNALPSLCPRSHLSLSPAPFSGHLLCAPLPVPWACFDMVPPCCSRGLQKTSGIVLGWVPSEAEPLTSVCMPAIYLGGDPRKHSRWGREIEEEGSSL